MNFLTKECKTYPFSFTKVKIYQFFTSFEKVSLTIYFFFIKVTKYTWY